MEKKIHYIIQEIFVENCQQKRDEALKKIMNEYVNFIKKECRESRI